MSQIRRSPHPALERLVAAADGFAAGTPQHDHLTAIVVRVLD